MPKVIEWQYVRIIVDGTTKTWHHRNYHTCMLWLARWLTTIQCKLSEIEQEKIVYIRLIRYSFYEIVGTFDLQCHMCTGNTWQMALMSTMTITLVTHKSFLIITRDTWLELSAVTMAQIESIFNACMSSRSVQVFLKILCHIEAEDPPECSCYHHETGHCTSPGFVTSLNGSGELVYCEVSWIMVPVVSDWW